MSNERIIKKYPNRRLYDTETSKYITLANVREMVLQGMRFKVVDSNTQEDITRQVLMQIIIDEEAAGKPLFSAEMLSQLIRFYGGTMQGLYTRYLEESLNLMSRQQEELAGRMPKNPMEAFANLTQKNLELWSDMQKQFFQGAGFVPESDKDKDQ